MKKRVLVIGINCLPELTGIGRYTGEMLEWLGDHGYETTMITAFPYYPDWKVEKPYRNFFYRKESLNPQLNIYRCPLYVPAKPGGMKRMIHEATFFLSAFFVVFRLLFKKKYDLCMVVAPPFHLGFLGLFYRFFRGTPVHYHIQDLQIDAAKELKMLKPDWIFSILFALEKRILKKSDLVSTISEGMRKKLLAKVQRQVMLFPNWVDTTLYFPVVHSGSLKSRWGFQPEDQLVLYSGSIGEKQGLDALIRVARELQSYPKIRLLICGTGPYKDHLIQAADDLENVYFFPLQKKEVFNDFLNIATVHLVLQKKDASDLVMPSKLTTILAVGGLVLVTANADTSLYDVITQHNIGVVIPPEDEIELKNAILDCCSKDYTVERKRAREFAATALNKDEILHQIFSR
ncbi:WcaI family glycosyltransferase [Pedobacter nutrimenti]|uniref:WcaI family glycosyltransferase n=1 Tax=Pedobacter nutrimenti TaxID=1241337 RepID=UPI0029309DC9|nr:WcaI family glycosyltransferase [Pedobacter nutrimenti]